MRRACAEPAFHISVLDIDETGLIEVISASQNRPATPGLSCQSGDVLLSCINPRIWRVAVVPSLPGSWTCSCEFIVLRPKRGVNPWGLAVALHNESVLRTVKFMAGGTSSSRQRVPKDLVLQVHVTPRLDNSPTLVEHAQSRELFYRTRLCEFRAYERLHQGALEFDLAYVSRESASAAIPFHVQAR